MLWMVLAALTVMAGLLTSCRAGTKPVSRPPARSAAQPAVAAPVARLFAGDSGTCRIAAAGGPYCWGQVPERVIALAREQRAILMAFFDPNPTSAAPYCVVSEDGTATCHAGCERDLICAEALSTISDVRSMMRASGAIVLIRRDGSMCQVAETEVSCGAGRLRVFGSNSDVQEAGPRVDLTMARAGRSGLALPDGGSCYLGKHDGGVICSVAREDAPARERIRSTAGDFSLRADGSVWGPGGVVDLVEGPGASQADSEDAPISRFVRTRDLVANELQVCGRNANGDVTCAERWSRWKQFGAQGAAPEPHAVPPLTCAEGLVAGKEHVCAQSCDNQTYCWGSNGSGQLALPPTATHTLDVTGVVELAVGGQTSCVLSKDGTVKCWGGAYPRAQRAAARLPEVACRSGAVAGQGSRRVARPRRCVRHSSRRPDDVLAAI